MFQKPTLVLARSKASQNLSWWAGLLKTKTHLLMHPTRAIIRLYLHHDATTIRRSAPTTSSVGSAAAVPAGASAVRGHTESWLR
ncbi:hypothetical protein FF1_003425 [Malus domestica]